MADEIQTARSKVKTKLDINDTTFDAMLFECIEQAIPRLAPFVQLPLAADDTISLNTGDTEFDLPTSGSYLKRLYKRTASTYPWEELDMWRQHANTIYLVEGVGTTTQIRVIAHRNYGYTDADFALLAANVPAAMLPLYLFAMAEFYQMVVGNKRKFNIYQQMNGVRTVAEMQELVEIMENRAIRILEDEISAEGR